MMAPSLASLQTALRDVSAFGDLAEYMRFGQTFLAYIVQTTPTRIVSPTQPHYFFYQYAETESHRITRPLNGRLFITDANEFSLAASRFLTFLDDLRLHQVSAALLPGRQAYIETNEINKVVYTAQQCIGCVGDSLENANQSRKRIGQLFVRLIKLIIQQVGVTCEPRIVKVPIPDYPDRTMLYELDVVFSRNQAIVVSDTEHIHPDEIVGSIKTTSKDRIDKVFLDKYMLTKLLQRSIPVVAIFLHDVQRASIRSAQKAEGAPSFGVASTFKTNHFLGYTMALNNLDGVYYVDPRPEMLANDRLREQIHDFGYFLTTDLWTL